MGKEFLMQKVIRLRGGNNIVFAHLSNSQHTQHTHTHSHTHTHTHILWDNIQLIYIGKDQGNGGKIREKSLEKIHVHCLGRV